MPHRFRPPVKCDSKAWALAEYLVRNGFPYQHIYADANDKARGTEVAYSESLAEAKVFIIKYTDQARR